eukprot:3376501-Rhodomonas_salina.5
MARRRMVMVVVVVVMVMMCDGGDEGHDDNGCGDDGDYDDGYVHRDGDVDDDDNGVGDGCGGSDGVEWGGRGWGIRLSETHITRTLFPCNHRQDHTRRPISTSFQPGSHRIRVRH